jgi:hypothetical protein
MRGVSGNDLRKRCLVAGDGWHCQEQGHLDFLLNHRVLDAGRRLVYPYRGTESMDRPKVTDLLQALRAIA